jgi:hypothetical protein
MDRRSSAHQLGSLALAARTRKPGSRFAQTPHPTLVAHAYDQRRRGDVRLHGVAFVHAHGIVFLALLVACLSLCERLAGLWLRPCYVSSLPSHVPFPHFQGAWLQVTYAPLRYLSLALGFGTRASRCPLVLGRSTTASTCELSPLASGPQGDTISVTFLLCVILGRQPRDTHCFLELLTYSHVKSWASRARLRVTTHSISIDHRPFNANLRYSASPYATCLTLALRIPARLSRPTHKPWALPNSR